MIFFSISNIGVYNFCYMSPFQLPIRTVHVNGIGGVDFHLCVPERYGFETKIKSFDCFYMSPILIPLISPSTRKGLNLHLVGIRSVIILTSGRAKDEFSTITSFSIIFTFTSSHPQMQRY
jgi:hypothetical protein